MQKRRLWSYSRILLFSVLVVIGGGTTTAFAVTSSSDHYQLTESQFSSGSSLDSCSEAYCAQATIGDDSKATTMNSPSFEFGSTSDEPVLEMIVDPGESNLGTLSTERTATKVTTIKVRNFLSGGYILQIIGDPPKYAGHPLDTSSTPTASQMGTEQFGINLAANTSPTVGAAPVQTPADQDTFGVANDNYKNANLFMYSSGDIVAHSSMESGQTDYTVSMIVNISSVTPAGHYSGDFLAVIMPAY